MSTRRIAFNDTLFTHGIKHFVLRLFEYPKGTQIIVRREIIAFIQRGLYGYAPHDTASVDTYISHVLVGMLQLLKDHGSVPWEVNGTPMASDKWAKILQTMIDGFEAHANVFEYKMSDEIINILRNKALKHFKQYFTNLWW